MLQEYSSIEGENLDYDAETLNYHFDTLILKTTKYVLKERNQNLEESIRMRHVFFLSNELFRCVN